MITQRTPERHTQSPATSLVPDNAAPRIAVLIPCFNEEAAIAKVVADFRSALPTASIFVYDNNSTDGTRRAARDAGATVRSEALQGKGNVVRRMFADVEADAYVLVDGDGTYDAASAPRMVDLAMARLARHGQRGPSCDDDERLQARARDR